MIGIRIHIILCKFGTRSRVNFYSLHKKGLLNKTVNSRTKHDVIAPHQLPFINFGLDLSIQIAFPFLSHPFNLHITDEKWQSFKKKVPSSKFFRFDFESLIFFGVETPSELKEFRSLKKPLQIRLHISTNPNSDD